MKTRLDILIANKKIANSRSQAESYIRLGKVFVNGKVITKPGFFADEFAKIELKQETQFVSRAALKLESVASALNLDFRDKIILDMGSSTGGFTEFALKNGAKKVIAVEVGTDQLHPKLRGNPQIELYEKTDIRDFQTDKKIDLILGDLSFISLREILPHAATLAKTICVMMKPQFEAGKGQTNNGIVKNDKQRREIIKNFEQWLRENNFVIKDKADSEVAGAKGNRERFYLLQIGK